MNNVVEGTITENLSPASAQLSIRVKWEPDSNEIDESDSQDEKHGDPRISTFRGISIDLSDEYQKGEDSIRFNRELDSKENDESDSQDEKYDDPRVSTFRGISIDLSDEPENAEHLIRFNSE
jgi:hypothetical protein